MSAGSGGPAEGDGAALPNLRSHRPLRLRLASVPGLPPSTHHGERIGTGSASCLRTDDLLADVGILLIFLQT